MRYDWTRYKYVTHEPATIAPLVGTTIAGMTDGFSYHIETLDGKRGVMREQREQAAAGSPSLRHLPICLVDYVEVAE